MNLSHRIKLYIAQKTGRVAKKTKIADLYVKEDKKEVKNTLLVEIDKRKMEIEETMLTDIPEKEKEELEKEYKKLEDMNG